MKEGFFVNGSHSFYTFGMHMKTRDIGESPKDEYIERVPFSNITYDFGRICGSPSYGERTLTYVLEFLCFDKKISQDKLINLKKRLKWSGREKLYDDMFPDYYFEVREPSVSVTENHGVYNIKVIFKASPEMRSIAPFTFPGIGVIPDVLPDSIVFPDVDGDGKVDVSDASAILTAYGKLSTGQPSGLSESQEKAADANMDGTIDSSDAALVQEFYSQISIGNYPGTKEGWKNFLKDLKAKREEVI